MQRRALRARDQLVRHNLRLIGHTSCRHRSSLPAEDESTADAFQEAAISLVRAAEKYDPSRGYCFSTYASFWVRRGFSEHERRGPPDDPPAPRQGGPGTEGPALGQGAADAHRFAAQPGLVGTALRGPELPCRPSGFTGAAAGLVAHGHRRAGPPCGGAGDDGAGLPLLERIAAPTDGTDPERSLLPLLLQRLSAEQRRLLWHRYLREHPLNPRQIQKVMGLEPEEQQRLEDEALKLLRQAASGKGARGAVMRLREGDRPKRRHGLLPEPPRGQAFGLTG